MERWSSRTNGLCRLCRGPYCHGDEAPDCRRMTMNKTVGRVLAYIPMFILFLPMSSCAHLGLYRLELQALPQEGRAPLTVSLVAEIRGGLDVSPELYCQMQNWDFGDGRRVAVFGMCAAWRPATKIDRLFGQHHIYEKPGVYEASVTYGSLKSEPVLVRVSE